MGTGMRIIGALASVASVTMTIAVVLAVVLTLIIITVVSTAYSPLTTHLPRLLHKVRCSGSSGQWIY